LTEKEGLKVNRLKSFKKTDPDIFNLDWGKFDLNMTNWDLESLVGPNKLFLGRFSEKDLNNMIQSIGLLKHLESMGFSDILIDLDKDENYIYYFKLYWKDKSPENQLLDLRVSENTFIPHERFLDEGFEKDLYDMILIEWLSAKNPLAVFDNNRPQLPGQSRPGLGILKYCFQLLFIISSEVHKDGFFDIPNHMHGAIMYSKKFKFFDPVQEAILRAAMRDLSKYSLTDISWGIITETIIDLHKNAPAVYDPGEQVHYVSNKMKQYFQSKKYVTTFKQYYKKKKYHFNYEEMLRKREKILLTREIEDL
jgi:hypothetical protein